MLKVLIRLIEFSHRFWVGVYNWGFTDALRVFFKYRQLTPAQPVQLHLKKLGRPFFFRGAADRGVVSHFYKAGYRIRDEHSAQKVRVIIDAGANIGAETLRFRYFHPQARIIAIEAEYNNYQLLQTNTHGDANILTLHKGLWSHAASLKIIPGGANEAFRVEEVQGPAAPPDLIATSIPAVMQDYALTEIDILKLDIEGAERQVFEAADTRWLAQVKVIIVEAPDHDSPGTTRLIFQKLLQTGLNYNCYIHGECFVIIRADVDWHLASDLFLERE